MILKKSTFNFISSACSNSVIYTYDLITSATHFNHLNINKIHGTYKTVGPKGAASLYYLPSSSLRSTLYLTFKYIYFLGLYDLHSIELGVSCGLF